MRMQRDLPATLVAQVHVPLAAEQGVAHLDGEPLPDDGRVPIGRHQLRVFSAEYEPWTQDITLTAGEVRTLEPPQSRRRRTTISQTPPDYTGRHIAYGVGAVGLVMGAVAVGMTLIADSNFKEWKEQDRLIDSQYPGTQSQNAAANDERLKSIWAMDRLATGLAIGSGVVLVSSMVVLFVTRGHGVERPPNERVSWNTRGLDYQVHF
jgi:hypothetical protein